MTACRVSLNEVLRLSRRVFLAQGAGPGCEHEPALAVVWLESRGLPGLAMLLRDCEAQRSSAAVTAQENSEDEVATLHIDGASASAAWIAATTADWLLASGAPCTVTVDAVRSPLWFVPDLAVRARERPGWMMARNAAGEVLVAAAWDEGGPTLRFWCDAGELAGREATVILGSGTRQVEGPVPARCLRPTELETRYAASLTAGVQVDDTLWQSLYEVARGALVPESEESRARGAGARGE